MATLLLIVIYFAFIGLGLPDSIFGSCWPAMREEFGLPISFANYVNLLITFFSILSSFFSAKLIKVLGASWVTIISTFATAIALFGFSYSNSYIYLLFLSLPLGFGAGAIDSALNNYVALNYKACHISFISCFYGLGVLLSPMIMGLVLKDSSWQLGYRYVAIIQCLIFIITLCSLPLWRKKSIEEGNDFILKTSIKEVFKIKTMRIGLLVFTSSCAVEFLCGSWGTTYLVGAKDMSVSYGALAISHYYLGMTIGRFLSGIFARNNELKIVTVGQSVVFIGVILLLLPLHYNWGIMGLVFIGLGNGPTFPNLTHLTPKLYGKENSQTIIGLQLAFSNIGVIFAPLIFGYIAEYSLNIFPYIVTFFYTILIIFFMFFKKSVKNNKLL